MIYRVVTYDKRTEHIKGYLIVPPAMLRKVKKLAGYQTEDDGLGEYSLDEKQAREVAKILGFKPETDRFYYYVEPFDPPDDSGFQEPASPADNRQGG